MNKLTKNENNINRKIKIDKYSNIFSKDRRQKYYFKNKNLLQGVNE